MESDCVAEWVDQCARRGRAGWGKARRDDGYGLLCAADLDPGHIAAQASRLIFVRAAFPWVADCVWTDRTDRLATVVAALAGQRVRELGFLGADAAASGALGRLAGSLENAGRQDKRVGACLDPSASAVALGILQDDDRAALVTASGLDVARQRIHPRLRRLPAPSRSVMKLEEASLVFAEDIAVLGGFRRSDWAVDLGAAPGGWTWWLLDKGMEVVAVDHGQLDPALFAMGRLTHERADGFVWRPQKPVAWVVCDMVDKPARVMARMLDWLQHGWARAALFNLKLPMQRRYQEVSTLLDRARDVLGEDALIRVQQLYHDREEVTVLMARGPVE